SRRRACRAGFRRRRRAWRLRPFAASSRASPPPRSKRTAVPAPAPRSDPRAAHAWLHLNGDGWQRKTLSCSFFTLLILHSPFCILHSAFFVLHSSFLTDRSATQAIQNAE